MFPKDKALVTVIISVDPKHVFDFNRGNLDFAGVLLFKLTNSKEIYISTKGNWELSCFGEGPEILCRLENPISNYCLTEFLGLISKVEQPSIPDRLVSHLETSQPPPVENGIYLIPKEIWRLVDFIYKYGLMVDELLDMKSDPIICQHFRSCLANGQKFDIEQLLTDFTTCDEGYPALSATDMKSLKLSPMEPTFICRGAPVAVASAIDTLCLILRAGKDPIVPFVTQELICAPEIPKDVLKQMPTANRNIFSYICSFLRHFILNYGGIPEISSADLGIDF